MPEPLTIFDRWSKVEQELRHSQRVTAAGQVAAVVMHDLNGPLEAAINLAYLIDQDAEDSSAVREHVRLQTEQLGHMMHIAQQSLDFYRSPENVKPVDLVSVAMAALRVHEHKFRSKQVLMDKVFPAETLVRMHPGELLQVLTNLIANALDALPLNGSLSIRVRKCVKEAHFTIVDNGHGIPPSLLTQIFEPFFTTKHDGGTGLGRAISKSIVERHHGRLKARSCITQGRSGTAFRVSLPLHSDDRSHAH